MDDNSKAMRLSTFKMPEAKNIRKIKENTLATCFLNDNSRGTNKSNIITENKTKNNGIISEVEKSIDFNSKTEITDQPNTCDKSIESQLLDNRKSSDADSKQSRNFSPAERLKTLEAILPYRDPPWAGICPLSYFLEEVKSGIIIAKVDLADKQRLVLGRLPSCDHVMEHPSISRHHAILQYRKTKLEEGNEVGWYLYDLDSVHGTWLNKKRVNPNVYIRLRVGHILKFGGSSRIFILQGPDEDQEAESELSLTELKELRMQQLRELELRQMVEDADALRKQAEAEAAASRNSDFCSWGMMEDAVDDDNQSGETNPFSTYEITPLELDDPKKTLRGYFDREGVEMPEYIFEELGFGKRICRIELPIDNELGEPVSAEVTGTGKKKDLVIQTALEACRMLDKHGLLRVVAQESRAEKRKRNWKDDDYYDSDEDVYLDRTGTIETKRRMRMSKVDPKLAIHTFDSLTSDIRDLDLEIATIEERLETDRVADSRLAEDQGLDSLDAFMVKIKSGGMDTKTKLALKKKLVESKAKRSQLERLLKAVTPAIQPIVKKVENNPVGRDGDECPNSTTNQSRIPAHVDADDDKASAPSMKSAGLPNIGKIKRVAVATAVATVTRKKFETYNPLSNDDVIENDEDDDDDVVVSSDLKGDVVNDADISDLRVEGTSRVGTGDLSTVVMATTAADSCRHIGIIDGSDDGDNDFPANCKNTYLKISDRVPTKNDHVAAAPTKSTKLLDRSAPQRSKESSLTDSKVGRGANQGSADLDEINWLPPVGQSGDGKTELNEKYGY